MDGGAVAEAARGPYQKLMRRQMRDTCNRAVDTAANAP